MSVTGRSLRIWVIISSLAPRTVVLIIPKAPNKVTDAKDLPAKVGRDLDLHLPVRPVLLLARVPARQGTVEATVTGNLIVIIEILLGKLHCLSTIS